MDDPPVPIKRSMKVSIDTAHAFSIPKATTKEVEPHATHANEEKDSDQNPDG